MLRFLMPTLTIRNLDEATKTALRLRAARHGVSMEQEVRDILVRSVAEDAVRRRKPTVAELMRLSRRPDSPFDAKAAQDELWDYLYQDDRG